MKSRIANRFLLTAVMALVLGVLLAVSSFAAYSLNLDGTVAGMEEGKTYTATPYDVIADTADTANAQTLAANTVLTAGVWQVSDGTNTEYLFVPGEKSGTINFWNSTTSAVDGSVFAGASNTFVPGKWTMSTDGAYSVLTSYAGYPSVCIWFDRTKYLDKAAGAENWLGATPKTGADNKVQESTVSYAFSKEQILPASAVKKINFGSSTNVKTSVGLKSGYDDNSLLGTFTFHVKVPGQADLVAYTIDTALSTKTFAAPAAMAEANGYLVAVTWAPYAKAADDVITASATDSAQNSYVHLHLQKNDNKIAFQLPSDYAAPTGITAGEGVLLGLQDGKYYQAAPMLLNAAGTALEAGEFKAVTATTPLAGLYVVRETNATQTVFSKATDMLYIYGDGEARENIGKLDDSTGRVAVKMSTGFIPGYWTEKELSTHSSFGTWNLGNTGNGQVSPAQQNAWVNAADDTAKTAAAKTIVDTLNALNYKYAFESEEVVKTSEVRTFKTTVQQNNGNVVFKYYRFKVVAYVADLEGNVTTYSVTMPDVAMTAAQMQVPYTVNFTTLLPADGYLVGLQFYPTSNIAYEEFVGCNTTYATRFWLNVNYDNYTIIKPATAPKFEVTANETAGFDINITNGSASYTYKYKAEGAADWTTVPAGKTVITVQAPGKYTVQVSGSELVGTAEAVCEVKKLAPIAPTVTATEIASPEAFKAVITNSAETYTYEYKAEGASAWTAIEGDSFEVAPGKYTVRAFGDIYEGEATCDFETVLATPVAPTVSVTPGASDFTIKIKNYSDMYVYEYKAEAATDWTAVTGDSFVVTEAGKYTVRAGGAVYNGYATKDFNAVDVPESVKSIVIDGKKITGLDAAVAYEFAKIDYTGIVDSWTAIPAGTEYTFADAGLYAIRVAATGTEDASSAKAFHIQGTIAERGTIIDLVTKNYANGVNYNKDLKSLETLEWVSYNDRLNPTFAEGKWTGWKIGDLAYWTEVWRLALGSTGNAITPSALGNKINDGTMSQAEAKAFIESYVFKYQYKPNEIIPLADLKTFKFTSGGRQGHVYAQGKAYTKVVVYVSDDYGSIEKRELLLEANYASATSKTTHTIAGADFEDTTGYIVAIDIHPYGYIPEATVLKVTGTTNNDFEVSFYEGKAGYDVILPKTPAPDYLTFDKETGCVEGLDPNLEYYYAPYTVTGVGETKFASGVDYLEIEAGLWGIGLVSTDPEYADSDPFLVFVRGDQDARKELGTIENKGAYEGYVTQAGDVWVQGVWTGTANTTHKDIGGTYSMGSTGGGNISSALGKALFNAIESGDKNAIKMAQNAIVDAAETITHLKYAYANDDVIPANELLNFGFKVDNRMGAAGTAILGPVNAEVTFYVVAPDGSINEYVWSTISTMTATHNVDVQSIENWPSEGWVVGLEIKPWKVTDPDGITIVKSGSAAYPFYNTLAMYTINPSDYKIKLDPGTPELVTFDAPANGLGEIANLNANMTYEFMIWDEAEGKYVGEGENGEDWIKVPVGSTSFRTPKGQYLFRVAESREFTASKEVVVVVYENGEFTSIENEVKKIHLPNDFVEVVADYEIDVTSKIWVARLALDNIKAVAPESNVIIAGDGYKFVIIADNLETDKLVHYYNFDVAFDGESRHDTSYENLKETAGELYITEFFFETADAYPFEDAQLYIEFGEAYEGQTVELSSFNERSGRIRKVEESVVENGWAVFTNFTDTYVVLSAED